VNTHLASLWARLSKSRRALLSAAILGSLALVAIFAELVAADAPIVAVGPERIAVLPAIVEPSRYEALDRSEIAAMHRGDAAWWPVVRYGPRRETSSVLQGASDEHPLGTDELGRDVLARLVYGTRTALGLSLGAVLCGMLLGVALGGLAGFYRGFWNDRLTRLVETVDTFPAIIIVALVRAIENEPSALSVVIGVSVVRWAEVARLMRVEVLRVSAEDFVTAARALGNPPRRVFYRHILPNAIGPVVVSSVFGVASVVLLEAAISFLGMGGPTRYASWGEMLAEAARNPDVPHLVVLPGLLLMLTVGATYLFADTMRDALDPRIARSQHQDTSPVSRLSALD
jgi:peptide/nickel transport system permease protein